MRRWAREQAYLRWLRPGLGVKRWLLLLVASLALLGLGIASLPQVIDFSAWWRLTEHLSPGILSPGLHIILLFTLGIVLLGLAVFGFHRALISASRHTSQDDVVEVVRRHRQRRRGPKAEPSLT